MVVTSLKVTIKRSLRDIYQFLMEPDNYLLWQSGLVEIRTTNGMRPGSVIKFVSLGLGKRFTLEGLVTENDGVSTFTVVSNRGIIKFESNYVLRRHKDETELCLTNHINTGIVFKLAEGALQAIGDARYEGDLNMLKTILENSPA